eukprot:491366_1
MFLPVNVRSLIMSITVSFVRFIVIFLLLTPNVSALQVVKSVSLTTSNSDIMGATIACIHSDCNINENEWQLSVSNRGNAYEGFHLQIDLDNSWGFHSTKPSTISLTMHGTHDGTTSLGSSDLDPVFSFSVNNAKYITVWPTFDNRFPNLIYPSSNTCEAYHSTNPTTKLANGDIKQCVAQTTCFGEQERAHKATGGDMHGYMNPKRDPPDNAWPTTITLTNDPINNELRVQLNTPSWSSPQGCAYGEPFSTNLGLQIYMAADEEDEHIEFTQFDISYAYDDTPAPSRRPSQPTPMPSFTTNAPTTTRMPTVKPTQYPTLQPSYYPSVNPTQYPTLQPSYYPTTSPTHDSTLNPSRPPTGPTQRIVAMVQTAGNDVSSDVSYSSTETGLTHQSTKMTSSEALDAKLIVIMAASFLGLCGCIGLSCKLLCYGWIHWKAKKNNFDTFVTFQSKGETTMNHNVVSGEMMGIKTVREDRMRLPPVIKKPNEEMMDMDTAAGREDSSSSSSSMIMNSNGVTSGTIGVSGEGELGQCTDCSKYKMGQVFAIDGDGMFYCLECWRNYEICEE